MDTRDRLAKRILLEERAALTRRFSGLLTDRQLEELGVELVDMADRVADAVLSELGWDTAANVEVMTDRRGQRVVPPPYGTTPDGFYRLIREG